MAEQYLPIAQYQSKSSRKIYTVCIRTTPSKPVILTCNCPGWTRRCPDGTDESRTCRHVEMNRRALEQYKIKGKAAQLANKPVIAPVQIRETMPTTSEKIELRGAREWLEIDEVTATISRVNRSL